MQKFTKEQLAKGEVTLPVRGGEDSVSGKVRDIIRNNLKIGEGCLIAEVITDLQQDPKIAQIPRQQLYTRAVQTIRHTVGFKLDKHGGRAIVMRER